MRHRLAIALLVVAACTQRADPGAHVGHAPPPASAPLAGNGVADPHAGHDAGALSGYAPVTLDPARAAALGMRLVAVEHRQFARNVRTVGVIALDETRTSHVHAKVRGFIESIDVDFVGKKVGVGQRLCTIYSQDVYAAELEFLSIVARARTGGTPLGEFAEAEARAQSQLVEAAKRRLALWDVPASEIERLEKTREAKRAFPLLAPRRGIVVEKQALDGMFVEPSVELFTVSDLSRVWVLADLYEADLPQVHVGDVAQLTIEGVPSTVEAKLAFLPPTLDEATRTLKARFELDNKDGRLRPGSFVSVTMDSGTVHGLAVPENAVIRTGKRNVVFVARGERGDHLEPREVRVGSLMGDHYRVESGLVVGDRVAVGAQFLLDSESRLRASGGGGGGHAGH